MIKNEATLQFSVGTHSLVPSVTLIRDSDRVNFLTFDKEYCEFGIANNLPNVTKQYIQNYFKHMDINIDNLVEKRRAFDNK